jgi:hypothetical protein
VLKTLAGQGGFEAGIERVDAEIAPKIPAAPGEAAVPVQDGGAPKLITNGSQISVSVAA